jgi:hypothetical protein
MAELMERIEQERKDGSMEEEASGQYKPTPLLGGIPRQRPGNTDDAEMTQRLGKPPGIAALVKFGQESTLKGDAVPVEFCLGDWLLLGIRHDTYLHYRIVQMRTRHRGHHSCGRAHCTSASSILCVPSTQNF